MKNSKSEIRNPKQIQNLNSESGLRGPSSSFGLRHSFVIRHSSFVIALCLLPSAFCLCAQAQYSLDWFTIDGGGGTSTGGVYSISGTIGQPDAGVMSGGPFSLVGGFWGVVGVIQTPGAPRLAIERTNGIVRVFWPVSTTDFVLEQTTNLVSAPLTNTWTQVPMPYETNATHSFISVAPPANKRFYRLRKL
jgi:hypothetical protein